LPARLKEDVIWNRTVNYRGKENTNLEMDLVNEYLNREFVTDLKSKGNLTEETVARHGAMVGSVKKGLRKVYAEVAGENAWGASVGGKVDTEAVVLAMVKAYEKERVVYYSKGRKVRGFEGFSLDKKVDGSKMAARLKKLGKKLDRRRNMLE
jgi:hypothetical protein